jgi:DNA-binding beta-propeller fold protein YncE
MLALIYLGLAICVGDFLCRRFYRFISIPHRWAAAILVGILLSTWFTYLAGLAFAHTAEPLVCADLLFFVVAPSAVFWLSRNAPKVDMITPRAPGSSRWDWITLGGLSVAVCVLLMGTLYVNKQGRIHVSGMEASDFAPQFAIAQSFALGHNVPTLRWRAQAHDFPFYFQAGNLEVIGLNLAWSVDVLSGLGLISMLALVMALGQLLFNSRVVGRLGAVLFFLHGSPPSMHFPRSESSVQDAVHTTLRELINQRHLPFAIGIFLLVLLFLVDQYRQGRLVTSAKPALEIVKSFVFSGFLLSVLLLWDAAVLRLAALVLLFVVAAYGLWWVSRVKTPPVLGPVVAATLVAFTVAEGVMDTLPICNSSRIEVNYDKQPLVKGLVFRNSVIYKLPDSVPPTVVAHEDLSKPAVTAFEGGRGNGRGQFESPRGIAIDGAGNIFVADTSNGRIEKFSPSGVFTSSIGTRGKGHGQFGEPNGLAIDRFGNIYVAEASNHRVQKLAPDGTFIAEWAPGFYGPRRIAIGPDDSIYVVDQGRTRIVKFSLNGRVLTTWGNGGSGDGQFRDHTSVAIDPTTNKVYVADPINKRIQVFDSDGNFLTKWPVPEWGQPHGFEDLAFDSQRGRLYASSANMSYVLVFDLNGTRVGNLMPNPPDKFDGPSGLALTSDKLYVVNASSARLSLIGLQNR